MEEGRGVEEEEEEEEEEGYLERRCSSRGMPSRWSGGCCGLLLSWSGVLTTTWLLCCMRFLIKSKCK